MSGSLNKVILVGNLGAEPDIRSTQSGDKVANLSIATSERWRDKNTNEMQTKTEWHRVVIFGALAGVCEKYLHKGSKVLIEGKITTRKWNDNGQDKYTTEVVVSGFGGTMTMLDSANSSGAGNNFGGNNNYSGQQNNYSNQSNDSDNQFSNQSSQQSGGGYADLDDDIPF